MAYAPIDLLHDLDRLAAALAGCDDALDAFLLSAAIWQLLEDRRDRDVFALGRAAGVVGGPGASALQAVRRAGYALRAARPADRAVARLAGEAGALTEALAADVLAGRAPSADAGALLAAVGRQPVAVRRSMARLPACFQSFDQHPADCAELARRVAARGGDRAAPLAVLGLRTSGSYLAPLIGAALRAEGFASVEVSTWRPGRPLRQRGALRRAARVLVCDDPPRTGKVLRTALGALERAGVARGAITLLLARFEPGEPFDGRDEVTLPYEDWHVHTHFAPDAVRATLGELFGVAVDDVARVPAPERPRRGHVAARYAATLGDGRTERVVARGVGLGFYGRHPLALAERLDGLIVAPYGLRDGVLYEPVADDLPAADDLSGELAAGVAEYVALRAERLAVGEDLSLRIAGENAVWEIAADALARGFGSARLAVRPLAHGTARALLGAEHPAVIDGATRLERWRRRDGRLVKLDYDAGAFGTDDRHCYDPVFDLAGPAAEATARTASPAFADALRAAWSHSITPERWLLDQLVHLVIARRSGRGGPAVERAMHRVYARWARERLLTAPPSGEGPVCALDVDGVVETRWNGFTAISPPAADAIRALNAHGNRVVLCTGRSLADVRERCADYGLAGGVAEYGAAIYDHADGSARSLLSGEDAAALDAVAAALRARPGVELEDGRLASVRAFRGGSPLKGDDVREALIAGGGPDRVTVVPGDRQTDFRATGCDKADGLRALLDKLVAPRLALAVGDTASDATMLALAEHAYAPRHARAALRGRGVRFTRGAYGDGLRDAVGGYLGHAPGGCPACERAPHPPAVDALLAALGARERGPLGRSRAALAMARALRRG